LSRIRVAAVSVARSTRVAVPLAVSIVSAVSFPAAIVAFLGGSRRALQG